MLGINKTFLKPKPLCCSGSNRRFNRLVSFRRSGRCIRWSFLFSKAFNGKRITHVTSRSFPILRENNSVAPQSAIKCEKYDICNVNPAQTFCMNTPLKCKTNKSVQSLINRLDVTPGKKSRNTFVAFVLKREYGVAVKKTCKRRS